MPAKNVLKPYLANGYYHVYNRGANKQNIFLDDDDYRHFLYLLKIYLSDPNKLPIRTLMNKRGETYTYYTKNFYQKIKILTFCLMPNHFHLLLHQTDKETIFHFSRAFFVNYSSYFNNKYERRGHLFQGVYKAAPVLHPVDLPKVSAYIHLNPQDLQNKDSFQENWTSYQDYPYSSYRWLVSRTQTDWFDSGEILSFFNKRQVFSGIPNGKNYATYIHNYLIRKPSPSKVYKKLLLDWESKVKRVKFV